MLADLIVRNYRRIRTADLVVGEGVTLVCGKNRNGKSSLAEATRAALTLDPLPGLGDAEQKTRTKKDAKSLVHQGADAGSVTLKRAEGANSVSWPSCEAKVGGKGGLTASAMAVGLRDASLVGQDQKARFVTLREVLKAEPGWNDFWSFVNAPREGAQPPPVSEDIARAAWGAVEKSGWVDAQAHAVDKGKLLKNAYKDLTGEAWGSAKGETWRPKDWDLAWDNQDTAPFLARVAKAEVALREAIGTDAVDQAHRLALETTAAGLIEAEARIPLIEADIVAAEAAVAAHAAKCAKFVPPGQEQSLACCPHCAKEVAVSPERGHGGGAQAFILSLPATTKLSDKDLKAKRMEAAALDGEGQRLKDILGQLIHRTKPDAVAAVEAAKAAQAKLDALPAGGISASPEAIVAAQAKLDTAKAALSMVDTVIKAKQMHQRLLLNQHLQFVLGDTGIRAAILKDRLEDFNATLAGFAKIADLGEIALHPHDASITVDGRPTRDLSGSEELRLRILLQLAIAQADGSSMIVVDVEDSTDRKHILGLIKMLNAAGMPALMVCHMNAPEDAPDLGSAKAQKAGYVGRTYWLDQGVARPVGDGLSV